MNGWLGEVQGLQTRLDAAAKKLVTVDRSMNPDPLAENFKFLSPYWQGNSRTEFIDKFLDPTEYKRLSLSNIVHFEPVVRLTDPDGEHFAIILQYHTKNGSSVWEAVLGTIEYGMFAELRSIYDLEATKKAHSLN